MTVEKYVEELTNTKIDMTKTTERMFEQEHLRIINMVTAINPGCLGGKGGDGFTTRGIMENKVITNLRCVSGDKSLFPQWHQKFITAVGQHDQGTRRDRAAIGQGVGLRQGSGQSRGGFKGCV